MLGLAGAILLLLWVMAVAALFAMQDGILFPAPQGSVAAPPPGFALVRIEAKPGEGHVDLPAFWHPPEPGETTIIRFHGNGDTIGSQRGLGTELAQAGFGVLLPEYRGYPGAAGRPSEMGLLADGEAAWRFVRRSARARAQPVALYGHSLGAAVAVHVASRHPVEALVLEAPFDSMLALVRQKVRWAPIGLTLRHPFRSDEKIALVDAPILVLHGSHDGLIPPAEGRRLAERAGARFEILEGAGHNDLWRFGALEKAIAFMRCRSEARGSCGR